MTRQINKLVLTAFTPLPCAKSVGEFLGITIARMLFLCLLVLSLLGVGTILWALAFVIERLCK
jgi:hypothetical protein